MFVGFLAYQKGKLVHENENTTHTAVMCVFSSPGQSPGRAIVLPPALASALALAAALAKSLTLKFFM